jgi:hypothetical protein
LAYLEDLIISGLNGCSGEVVLGHNGSCGRVFLRVNSNSTFSTSRLAERARTEALLKLLLIYADGARDADHAVGRDLALPDPQVHGISGNPESVGNFAYLGKSGHHRQDLVLSSNHG